MTKHQLTMLTKQIVRLHIAKDAVRRSDVIRDVVRTKKLNLDDSIRLADLIVKGLFEAGKPIVTSA